MRSASLRRQVLVFAGGFLTALLLVSGIFATGAFSGMQARASAKHAPANFVPQHTNLHVSSIRYAAQYFLHDHLAQTQKLQATFAAQHVSPRSATTGPGAIPNTTVNGGALAFNSDPYVFTQNEESYAVDPATVPASGQLGIIGVAGFNDFRGFFLNTTNTFSGYAVSKNVSCTAGTCAQLLKDGWLPAVTDPKCSDGSLLAPFGDPSIAAVNGTFYYATLASYVAGSGSSACGSTNGDNGIIVAKSNANLENASAACNDALTTNSCWTSTLIHESQEPSGCFTISEPCNFDDKEWITVDPSTGNLTVAWDYLDDDVGTEVVDATTCSSSLTCSAAAKVSVAPAQCNTAPCDDTFAPYLATWHNPNTGTNDTILTYDQFNDYCPVAGSCNFNVDLHLADLTTDTDQTFASLPPYLTLEALAGDQFRITTQAKVAADYRNIASPQIYVTWDQCIPVSNPADGTNDGAAYYSIYTLSGACAQSQVQAANFTGPTASPSTLTVQGGTDQFMPSIAVDEFGSTAGHVALAYYSTQGDAQTHALIRPYAGISTGGTGAFNTTTYDALNTVNNRYGADPAFELGFVGPLLGDYMQVATADGGLFVNFSANYVKKAGPSALGTVSVAQQDNYLCYIQPGTAYNSTSACTSA